MAYPEMFKKPGGVESRQSPLSRTKLGSHFRHTVEVEQFLQFMFADSQVRQSLVNEST